MTRSALCIARASLCRTTGLESAGARSDLSHCAVATSRSGLFMRLLARSAMKCFYFTHIRRAPPSNSSIKATIGPFAGPALRAWPSVSEAAARPLQVASSDCIVRRGSGCAALPQARVGRLRLIEWSLGGREQTPLRVGRNACAQV